MSLSTPTNVIKKLNTTLSDYIWRKKPHHLKKDVTRGNREEGGLEVLDFTVLNNPFKIKWITEPLKNPDNI